MLSVADEDADLTADGSVVLAREIHDSDGAKWKFRYFGFTASEGFEWSSGTSVGGG
jgi:hypothetical protein